MPPKPAAAASTQPKSMQVEAARAFAFELAPGMGNAYSTRPQTAPPVLPSNVRQSMTKGGRHRTARRSYRKRRRSRRRV
jgi:hypothetical protein